MSALRRQRAFATIPLLLSAIVGCAPRSPARPKNLVLITIDTLRSDKIGAYGNPSMRTPAIDRLAREGVVFAGARSAIPITLPSHTSILTGLYPRSHLVLSHAYTLAAERRTITQALKEHGYATAAFVSSHVLDKKFGLDRGFDVYWQRWTLNADRLQEMIQMGLEPTTEAAAEWIEGRTDAPFFLWAHYFQPHKPYAPRPPLDRLYDRDYSGGVRASVAELTRIWTHRVVLDAADARHLAALYEGEVTAADSEVGKLIATLERKGLLDDTIVVLTADHGEVLYEHDFYFGHDIMLYQQALSVPMIVRAKGLLSAGRLVSDPVRLIDLAPTFLEALGIPADEAVGATEGKSLIPLATRVANAPVAAPPDTLHAEVFPPKPNWKTEPRHALSTERWKLILEDGNPERKLYRLESDPLERENLAASEPDTLAAFVEAWDTWVRSKRPSAAGFPRIDPETEEALKSLGYIDNN